MPKRPPNLIYGVDDTPPLLTRLLLGVQHVFIITISLIFPVLIVRTIGGSAAQAGFMVSMSMLAAGVGTILQALNRRGIGSGYLCPAVCGPSFLSASLLAAKTGGLSLLFGMTTIAGMFEVLLSRVIHRFRVLFPPEVTGTVVAMVGITIIPVAISNFMGLDAADTVTERSEVLVALMTLGAMVGTSVWCRGKLKLYPVLVGMILGYLLSYLLGILGADDLRQFSHASLLAVPELKYFGWSFDLLLLAPFLIAITCSVLKTVGDITTCQKINDSEWKRVDMQNVRGGILADGLSATIGGLVGTMGQSTSSSNIGLSIGTGATSRKIAFATGGILVLLAFIPKLAAIFVIMPKPVMGATLLFAVSFMIVAGLQIIMSRMLDVRKTCVIGISIIFGLSVDVLSGLYEHVHPWIHPIFSSSLSLAAVLAVSLNLLFRIGIARRQQLVLRPGVDTTDAIFAFFEKQGAAWGARREVIYRAIAALSELYESVALLGLAKSEITVDTSFDEFNLDVDIRYTGARMEFTTERPPEVELLRDTRTTAKLAGFMIMHYVDRLKSEVKGDRCRIQFHFEH